MVVIKGGKWKLKPRNEETCWDNMYDIELLSPTSEEIKNLKVGDRVLVEMEYTGRSFFDSPIYVHTNQQVVAIIKEEKSAELPEEVTISPASGDDLITLALAVNAILRHLKAKENK